MYNIEEMIAKDDHIYLGTESEIIDICQQLNNLYPDFTFRHDQDAKLTLDDIKNIATRAFNDYHEWLKPFDQQLAIIIIENRVAIGAPFLAGATVDKLSNYKRG